MSVRGGVGREKEKERERGGRVVRGKEKFQICYFDSLYLTKRLDVLYLEALEVAHEGMNISGRHVTILVLQQGIRCKLRERENQTKNTYASQLFLDIIY